MYNFYDYKNLFEPNEILVYLRKSRSDDPLLSIEEVLLKHETILNEWCDRNLSGTIPEENRYREIVSGETISDRPAIQNILKLIESPKYKAILCVEIQRLSRGDLEDAGRLIKLLRYTDTYVITPQKTYDLKDEYDRDIFERELKRGNEFLEYQKKIMNRGRLLSVSQGNYIGSIPPYGYDKAFITENNKKYPVLTINTEQADIVRLIFDLYVNKDYGYMKIAKHLDELGITPPKGEHWSHNALSDMLSNVHYIGKVKWNWRKTVTLIENSEVVKTRPKSKLGEYLLYDGKHQPIISEELFNLAQEKKGKNARITSSKSIVNPLAGLIYCQCGRAMTLRKYKHKDGTERCSSRLLCDNQARCGTGSCTYDEMIKLIQQVLKQNIADFELKLKGDDTSLELHKRLIKNLENKLADIQKKEITQWEMQSDPDVSKRMPQHIFQQLKAKLQQEKADVENALKKAHLSTPKTIEYKEGIQRFSDALNSLLDDNVSAERKNTLLKACIERITYTREKPERAKSQKIFYYDREQKKTRKKSPLNVGASWTNPPIELDIKLKV